MTTEQKTEAPLALGAIVRSNRLHGLPFGTVQSVRNQTKLGRGWGRIEYRIDHFNGRWRSQTWIDENFVEVVTLDAVLTYYDERERDLNERIKKLRDMVGTKVPKFNPAKHLDGNEDHLSDAYRHEDGSLTYVLYDAMGGSDTDSPRTYDGNVSTLIQTNTRCIDIDSDDAGLDEARARWYGGWGYGDFSCDQTAMMTRYLAMFRPDVVHYDPHWSAGDSYGWGYVTREDWVKWMGEDYDGDVTPERAFDQEVSLYGQWANGEVYISVRVAKRGAEPDWCHGHLGYDDHKDIATQFTDSPILEVLA